jgi:hypothetical protein
MVADFVTTTSCTSPGSLPTRAQAELMVSFIRSILSEIFAIAEESKTKKINSPQTKDVFKISICESFCQHKSYHCENFDGFFHLPGKYSLNNNFQGLSVLISSNKRKYSSHLAL